MRFRILPVNIVLCLVMLVRRSTQVQHLDTGYLYAVGDEGDGRYLKCAFWYSGKIHMQLTKLLLKLDGLAPSTLDVISGFEKNTVIHLAVLYKLKSERIGALWLVHLYVSKVQTYFGYLTGSGYSHADIVEKMTTIHDYIVEKLESETAAYCPEGNDRFDWRKRQFAGEEMTLDNVKAMIEQNTKEMYDILENNNLTRHGNIGHFKVCNILLLTTEVRQSIERALTRRFSVHVDWRATKQLFANEWSNTRDLDFATNELRNIKSYLLMVLDILKVIIMRMSWKHLECTEQATLKQRPYYMVKWIYRLKDFAAIFSLQDTDTHIQYLIEAFGHTNIGNIEFIVPLIRHIRDELKVLSAPLGCDAIRPFPRVVGNIANYNPENPNHVDQMIKLDSLKTANMFNEYIKENIVKYNFGITLALLRYIDEPEPYSLFENINNLRIST